MHRKLRSSETPRTGSVVVVAAWLPGTGRVRSKPSKAFLSGLDTGEAAAQHDLPRGQGCGGCDCVGGGSGRNSGRSAPLHQGWTTRPLQGPRTANHLCALGEAPPLPCTSVTSEEPEQSKDADKCLALGARAHLAKYNLVLTLSCRQYCSLTLRLGFAPYLILVTHFTTPRCAPGRTQEGQQLGVSSPVHLTANFVLSKFASLQYAVCLTCLSKGGKMSRIPSFQQPRSRQHRCMLQRPPNPKLWVGL